MGWFQKDVQTVLKEQTVSIEHGLSSVIAQQRLVKYGKNQLQSAKKINPLTLFLGQFKDVLVIILLVAAVISWGVGKVAKDEPADAAPTATLCEVIGRSIDDTYPEPCNTNTTEKTQQDEGAQEALLIFAIVIAIALIGFFNEYKAEKTVEALKKLVGQKAKVRRDGNVIEIDASDIVPGDIVVLDEGAKVPADIRLIQVRSLQINEASLTGESLPVTKQQEAIDKNVSLGDQRNMAFAGTFVTEGTAEGVVVATAQLTELGKIATLVNDVESEETPMQRKLDDLGKKLGILILAICAVVFVIVLLLVDEARDKDFLQRAIFAFTAAVALAVAAIPEGLAGTDLKHEKDLIAEAVISVLRKIFDDGNSANAYRIERVLRNAIYTAFTVSDATLFTILLENAFKKLGDMVSRKLSN
jgi:Ca2+-transporting ATPase